MKIQFIGATHEVTGSCTLLEVGGIIWWTAVWSRERMCYRISP